MMKKILWLIPVMLMMMKCTMLEQFVQKPTISYDKMELKEFAFDEATLLFRFKINNPNPIGMSIDRIDYQLDLNGAQFVKGDLDQGVALTASGVAPLEFPITIRYFEFFKSIRDFIKSNEIQYNLSGSMRIGPFDVPYQTSGKLPVPKLPDISLKQVQIDQISLMGATLLFTLSLKNQNAFTLQPQAINYDISLAETSFASGKATQINSVGSGDESLIQLPVTVNFLDLGKSAYHLLTGSSSSYQLSGNLEMNVSKAGIKIFPFKKQGNITLKR